MTTKAGFMNSDGWIDRPAKSIQRRAPLTSTPMNSAATISTSATASTISAVRRTCRGVRNEVAIITASAGTKKATGA